MKLKLLISLIVVVLLFVYAPKIGCMFPIYYTQSYVIKLRVDDNKISEFKKDLEKFASQENSDFVTKQYPSQTVGDSFVVNHMGFCNFQEYIFTINSFDKNRYDIFLSHNMLFSDADLQSKARSFVNNLKEKYEVIEHGKP
ncbi:MAG: hypothetical protein ABJP02_17620 [Parasphingorhabdus sp.]|uniref:hypothetical protein n=1 Tax=Parasphingorhabdus sp. TaxID=2709688 RepID=UPI0032978976